MPATTTRRPLREFEVTVTETVLGLTSPFPVTVRAYDHASAFKTAIEVRRRSPNHCRGVPVEAGRVVREDGYCPDCQADLELRPKRGDS